jgi:hypothetical protein
VGFREGPLTFAPTFKVRRALADEPHEAYAQPKDVKKLRVPAYCDRVLCASMAHVLRDGTPTPLFCLCRPSDRPRSVSSYGSSTATWRL